MGFNFYTSSEQYLEKFYQLPIVFFEDNLYKNMSNDSKIAYSILKDRFNYSVKNNWIDKNDQIYFIFTNKELQEILNVSNKTVIKIKKELTNLNLLYQEQQGMNKANKLYLGKPQISATNSYQNQLQTLDKTGSVNFTHPEKHNKTLDNTGSVNFTHPEKHNKTLDNTGSVNFTHNLYKYSLDTLQDTLLDTGLSDSDLEKFAQELEQEIDNPVSYSIPEKAKQTLLTFALNDYKALDQQIGMIFRAKKEVSKKLETSIVIEYFEEDFVNQTKIIALTIYKDKKSLHRIQNYDSYFYKSYVRYFEEQVNKEQQLRENSSNNLPKIPGLGQEK